MHIRIFAGLILIVCFKWYGVVAAEDLKLQPEPRPSRVEKVPLPASSSLLCELYYRTEMLSAFAHSSTKGDNRLAFHGQGLGVGCEYRRGIWRLKFAEGVRSEDFKLYHREEKWMGTLSVSTRGMEWLLGAGTDFGRWDVGLEVARHEMYVDDWQVNWLGVFVRGNFADFTWFANDHLDPKVALDTWKIRLKGGVNLGTRVHLGLGVEWGMLQPKGNIVVDEVGQEALKHGRVDYAGTIDKLRGTINLPSVAPEFQIRGRRWALSTKVLWGGMGVREDWTLGVEVGGRLLF